MRFQQIRKALAGKLWFVHEAKMNEIMAFLELKLSGGSSAPEVLASIRAENEIAAARSRNAMATGGGAVAVIPIYGLIMHRGGSFDLSGPSGTSCDSVAQQLRQAVNDPNVKGIVLDIDSPGGDVDGVDELATEIFNARKQKKITAVSNCLCASAAYYLAAQASEVVVSPSSLTGSIGVYTMHEDDSKWLDELGIKFTLIKFGENKTEGNSFEPLSDAALAHLQEMVDTFGNMFEKAVARGRRMKQGDVHGKFGQGRVFDAKKAVSLGMADRIATLDEVLQDHGVARPGTNAASAGAPSFDANGNPWKAALAQAKKKSDVGDPDDDVNDKASDTECVCPCDQCEGGDCDTCSHEGCDCSGCTCAAATEGRAKAHGLNRRRLELAAL